MTTVAVDIWQSCGWGYALMFCVESILAQYVVGKVGRWGVRTFL